MNGFVMLMAHHFAQMTLAAGMKTAQSEKRENTIMQKTKNQTKMQLILLLSQKTDKAVNQLTCSVA